MPGIVFDTHEGWGLSIIRHCEAWDKPWQSPLLFLMAFNDKDLLAPAIQHSFKSANAIKGAARMPFVAIIIAPWYISRYLLKANSPTIFYIYVLQM